MTYSSEVLADSPLGYWRLGDASGTTMTDSSGNSHNGTYVTGVTLGQTSLLTGDSDTCADFASGEANVAGAAWMSSPTAVTVEAIIRPRTVSAGSYNFIAVRDDSNGTGNLWWVVLKGTKLTALCRGTEFSGSTTIVANTTYHVVFTYDGTTAKLYVNGSLDGSASLSGSMSTVAQNIFVGRWGNAGFPLYFDGKIDELAYYGSALSSGRISAHYTAATTNPSATVSAVAATATAAAAVPAVSASSSVAPPAATVTGAALAPTVSATGTATVSPPAATSAATALPPTLTADATVAVTAATAAAAAVAPTVAATSDATVVAVVATATAIAPAPAVTDGSGNRTVAPPAATATATALAPTVTQIIPAGTDTSNSLNGRRRRARGSVVVVRPAAGVPSRAAVKYDKSVPYPPPTLVNGRPT